MMQSGNHVFSASSNTCSFIASNPLAWATACGWSHLSAQLFLGILVVPAMLWDEFTSVH